jgi:2-polyprenyl-6-methoxyphenol hydroxylase-like FAD-dependent oxidoreductase
MTNGPVVAPWDKSVLISGIGVAGPALAYWLALYGFKTALVEKSPQLRTGGYIIDFWGRGFDVAEKMGILPALKHEGYDVKELRLVGTSGRLQR